MEQKSSAPRKKSTPINQLPDIQQPKVEEKRQLSNPQQGRILESDNELVQRVLTSMQEPSQINIQEKRAPVQENDISNDSSNTEESLTNKLMKEGKEPLLIAALAYLSNQEFVINFIQKYLPKVVDAETKNVSPFGFLIKALLVGVLFYIIKKYIFNK